MIHVYTPSVLSAPPLALFRDNFSSGDFSHAENGVSWGPSRNAVTVTPANPYGSSGYSAEVDYHSSDPELRMQGFPLPTEIFMQWRIYYPSGNENPFIGPAPIISGGMNDKDFRLWGATNAALGTAPAVNTCGASTWDTGGGTLPPGSVGLATDASVTTVRSYTDILVDATLTTVITSVLGTFAVNDAITIPAGQPLTAGDYLVTAIANTGHTATVNAPIGALNAGPSTGTGYRNGIAVGPMTNAVGPSFQPYIPYANLGKWLLKQVRCRMATVANNDGVIQHWIDGVLTLSRTNLPNWATPFGPSGFSNAYFLGAQNNTPQVGRKAYLADFVISLGGFA